MKILLCSYVFAPHIGGIETVSKVLAGEFSRLGAKVTVVTETPGDSLTESGYEVVRRPRLRTLRALAFQSDLIFQSNISLQSLVPLLFCGRPIVITHHGPLARPDGSRRWQEYCKAAIVPFCRNLAVSAAVAASLPVKSTVIGNPFEVEEFTLADPPARDKDIVFMGRLVSVKGCHIALRALAELKAQGISANLTVIGDGPELPALRQLSAALGIAAQVEFAGVMRAGRGREVARHKILLIPSLSEPFGVVALEGLAAGCALAASNVDGLPEAVGDCGLLFPANDVPAAAAALKQLLHDPGLRQRLVAGRDRHLQRFLPQTSARNYLDYFDSVLNGRAG